MQRIVYSVYVDVPAEEHYGQSKLKYDTTEKASVTVNAFKKHYDKLVESKLKYANGMGAEFILFKYDEQYLTFANNLKNDFPELTGYEVINFYKIHLVMLVYLNHVQSQLHHMELRGLIKKVVIYMEPGDTASIDSADVITIKINGETATGKEVKIDAGDLPFTLTGLTITSLALKTDDADSGEALSVLSFH